MQMSFQTFPLPSLAVPVSVPCRPDGGIQFINMLFFLGVFIMVGSSVPVSYKIFLVLFYFSLPLLLSPFFLPFFPFLFFPSRVVASWR